MEETKLDKVVDKLFRFVERISTKFINATRTLSPYLGIFVACFYIIYLICTGIDIYYNGWKFKQSNGTVNMGFVMRLILVFFVHPFQVYFFNRNLFKDVDSKLLKISSRFYVEKVVNDCFKPIIADWREEYFEAIKNKRKLSAVSINFRYSYAFVSAMIQQSSLHRILDLFRIFTK